MLTSTKFLDFKKELKNVVSTKFCSSFLILIRSKLQTLQNRELFVTEWNFVRSNKARSNFTKDFSQKLDGIEEQMNMLTAMTNVDQRLCPYEVLAVQKNKLSNSGIDIRSRYTFRIAFISLTCEEILLKMHKVGIFGKTNAQALFSRCVYIKIISGLFMAKPSKGMTTIFHHCLRLSSLKMTWYHVYFIFYFLPNVSSSKFLVTIKIYQSTSLFSSGEP